MKKIILIIILSIAVIAGGVFLILNLSYNNLNKEIGNIVSVEEVVSVIDEKVISEKLEKISELATNKYEYSNVLVMESNKKKFGIDIPLSESIKVVRFEGVIKAGIDFKGIDVEKSVAKKSNIQSTNIEGSNNKNSGGQEKINFIVKIPKSIILDNFINTDKTVIEDVKEDVLSDDISQDIIDAVNDSKLKIEKKLIKSGFLKESDEHVKKVIKTFLEELKDTNNVNFEYKYKN